MTRDRRALLLAALGFLQLREQAPEVAMLHRWLDSWKGLGLIVTGMERQGYDVRSPGTPTEAAGDVLRERDGALAHRGHRLSWKKFLLVGLGKAGESITRHSVDTPRQTGKCNEARRPSRQPKLADFRRSDACRPIHRTWHYVRSVVTRSCPTSGSENVAAP